MNAESVKARLKNRSKETGKTLQELLPMILYLRSSNCIYVNRGSI